MDTTHFRPYDPDQMLLMPPSLHDWLPERHLAFFILEVVDTLDLSAILNDYDGAKGGYPPYHAKMMTALILYSYCEGVASSRKIEKATHEQVPFRVVASNQHPDHDTIAEFRRRHLKALAGLFLQVLQYCQDAGLVKLGHVALDGTKIRANASKHKAMSYGRMKKKRKQLRKEIEKFLKDAEQVDAEEDAKYGKGVRGDELPEELRFRKGRLQKIREGMKAIQERAKAQTEAKRAEIEKKEEERDEDEKPRGGRKPAEPSDVPSDTAQYNFTDPDSRIMVMGSTKSFEQCYNAQAAVDAESQVVVAAEVTQEANDKQQLAPMVDQIEKNVGLAPEKISADSGYFSQENVQALERRGVDGFLATGRQKHGEEPTPAPRGRIPDDATVKDRMRRKLQTKKGRETYARRKSSVEPVFGQIKDARGFRRFLLRGIARVRDEWRLICLTNNILKLFRRGWRAARI
jgi:transposase